MLVVFEHSPEPESSAYSKKMNTHALAGRGERPDQSFMELRPDERLEWLAARAEVSFDCSLPLQSWRRCWLVLLSDPWFCCACGLQSRSV